MGKRAVTVRLSSDISYEPNLNELLNIFREAKERCEREGLMNPMLRIEQERGYYDDISVRLYLEAWRDETDEEYELRIRQEEQRKKQAEQSEYAQYIGLKRKFEGRSNDKFK